MYRLCDDDIGARLRTHAVIACRATFMVGLALSAGATPRVLAQSVPALTGQACTPVGVVWSPIPIVPSPSAASAVASAGLTGEPPSSTVGPTPSGSPGGGPSPAITRAPRFRTYRDGAHRFSIEYIDGWQRTDLADGVRFSDGRDFEEVRIAPLPADLTGCVFDAELPRLRSSTGATGVIQEEMMIHGLRVIHLAYQQSAPAGPDSPPAGTTDRYYVPGLVDLAIVTWSTGDGTGDAEFARRIVRSLSWR